MPLITPSISYGKWFVAVVAHSGETTGCRPCTTPALRSRSPRETPSLSSVTMMNTRSGLMSPSLTSEIEGQDFNPMFWYQKACVYWLIEHLSANGCLNGAHDMVVTILQTKHYKEHAQSFELTYHVQSFELTYHVHMVTHSGNTKSLNEIHFVAKSLMILTCVWSWVQAIKYLWSWWFLIALSIIHPAM